MLPAKHLALLNVARRQLGLSEDDYRRILRERGGVASARDLDAAAFKRVVDHLERLGFVSTARRRELARRPDMASTAQLTKIDALWTAYTDGVGTTLSLGKWLERTFKVSSARFLTREAGQKAITALNAMTAKKAEKPPP